MEKGYNELVEVVVRRLVEIDLYKAREIQVEDHGSRVFKNVIWLEEIKIEVEKMKGVLDWLIPKGVKDIQKFLELANYHHQFIKDFAVIARPLHNMVEKDQK